MTVALDKKRFGPWALVTGASSGIGKEFAQQIAASGINIVLVARREDLLKEVGVEFSKRYGVEHRVVVLDVSREDFIGQLASATDDIDIGLVVSNAGTPKSGRVPEARSAAASGDFAAQHDVAFRHRPLLRPEARRAEAGRLDPRGGNGCGKRHSLYGK